MKTQSKRELIEISIDNIFTLLLDACGSPSKYIDNVKFVTALKSQGALCDLEMEFSIDETIFSIHPLSLNTLKSRIMQNTHEKSLSQLDKLRRTALRAILGNENTSKKRTKSALEDQIIKLKDSADQLRAANLVLIQALAINRRDLITISNTNNNGLRQKRINDALNRIIKILNLNPGPFDDIAILSMKTHLELVHYEKKDH